LCPIVSFVSSVESFQPRKFIHPPERDQILLAKTNGRRKGGSTEA
jgi:hypothetical protein